MSDSLEALRQEVLRFRDARAWSRFHTPKNLAMAIGVESAELSELFLWKDDAEVAEALARPDFREKVSHEMADVLVLLLTMSESVGLDLAAALRAKLEVNGAKYPVEKSYGRATKSDAL